MNELNARDSDLSALKIDRARHSAPPGRWKRWLHLLWVLVPVVFYVGYQMAIKKVTPALKVKVDTVKYLTGTEASVELVATGYVVAQVKADVSSKATGRLKRITVEAGDTVLAGQVLAELDNEDFKADLEVARADLRQAQADSVATELNFNRQKRLFEKGVAPEDVVENATAAFHRALASVEAMKARVRSADVALENSFIRAPFNGTILTKQADVGEMVAPLAAGTASRGSVVTMADMTSLEVEADVSESNIQKVIVGQPCEIVLDAYPQVKYAGRVKKIIPTADRTRATVMTKVTFSNIDSRVLPEMSARVSFLPVKNESGPTAPTTAIVVKSEAVTQRDGKSVVFKVQESYARQTPVIVGRQLGDVKEILS
ncbi:MAG: efflux RND transporter periplasmic adaptor subunit, partial [candidate division Zixibacteria bacterium]|nr:efflux RND transporter periplasmic adaptor subunit [candidate division Zixibacteria bacterium]